HRTRLTFARASGARGRDARAPRTRVHRSVAHPTVWRTDTCESGSFSRRLRSRRARRAFGHMRGRAGGAATTTWGPRLTPSVAPTLDRAGHVVRRPRPPGHRSRDQPAAHSAADPDLDRRLGRGGAQAGGRDWRRLLPPAATGGRLGGDVAPDAHLARGRRQGL